ncbi:unnamed protein product, partial [Strongylus vulgaris]
SPAPQAAPVAAVTAGVTLQPDAIAEAQAKAQAALAQYLAQSKNLMHQQQQKKEEKKDNTRPISSTPVSGTAWCVVWTGDGKVFFYNPSTKTSVWERPPEMYGRADVDVLVSKCPEVKKDEPEHPNPEAESDGSDDEETEDGGPPKKKSRSERKKEALLAQQKKDKDKPVRQMLEKPVDPAVQAELQAQRDREK